MHFGGPVHRFSGLFMGWKKVDHCVTVGFIHCGFVVCGSGRRQPPACDAAGTVQWLIRWGGEGQTAPLQLPMGLLICPSWRFLHFLAVVVNVRVCKCLWNSLYTCSCKYNFAMVTPVFTSCGPFKKSLFTCATLLLSFWRKYHESHTSCSSPLTQTGWRGTFFMKYDCERVIGWTFWGNSHK